MKKKAKRTFIVFSSLVGGLTVTSALLLYMAPAPLRSETAPNSLLATSEASGLDPIFQTTARPAKSQWKYIYIHQSKTPSGGAAATGLTDHFVIGNGDGCGDGEIQYTSRWDQQQSALPPGGASEIDPACITISLIGDFDHTVPTPTQIKRATQLIAALQAKFDIAPDHVLSLDGQDSAAGTGKYFPMTSVREQLR